MTSEMEAAFEAVHRPPDPLVEEIMAQLERDAPVTSAPPQILERERVYAETGKALLADEPTPQELTNRALLEVDSAIGELRGQIAELRRKPPRERRTGAAARLNPDVLWLAYVVLAGVAVFVVAALGASFAGQYAMARYTRMPEELWVLGPMFIELPLLILAFAAPVFRRRKQRGATVYAWILLGALAAASSAINVIHVYLESGFATIGDIVGACTMGAAPILAVLAIEIFILLAVKPQPEPPAPAPATRKPAPNRKGTKK